MEGCPCHNDLLINCRSHKERGVALMRAGVAAGHCPWAGRRGTELVRGRLREMVQDLRSTCTESSMFVRSQLSQEEFNGLASDAATMGAEVSSEIEVKCGSMWYEAPHILVGFSGEDVGYSTSEVNACIKKHLRSTTMARAKAPSSPIGTLTSPRRPVKLWRQRSHWGFRCATSGVHILRSEGMRPRRSWPGGKRATLAQ